MLLEKEYQMLSGKKLQETWSSNEDILNAGLPSESIEILGGLWSIERAQVAKLIGLTLNHINQFKVSNESLDSTATERALLMGNLYQGAVEYFRSSERAQRWMKTVNIPLGGKTPLEVCQTMEGIIMVKNKILQLEYGMVT